MSRTIRDFEPNERVHRSRRRDVVGLASSGEEKGSGDEDDVQLAEVSTIRDGKVVLASTSTGTRPKPSKPSGCRSKTLTPTPEPCGILRGRCRRRTWRSCGRPYEAWNSGDFDGRRATDDLDATGVQS